MLAKLKSEVRLREPENWFNIVDKNGDKAINVAELTAHLTKIAFNEPMNFIAELKRKDEEFKINTPNFLEEIRKIIKGTPTP